MMATLGASMRSRHVKSRPCLIAIPKVGRYPGRMVERRISFRSLTGGSGWPSTAPGERANPLPAAGSEEVAATLVTPGRA